MCLHTGFRETAHEEHPKGTRPHAYSTLNPILVSPALSCIPSILSHSPRRIISRFSFFPVILKCNTFLSLRRIAVGDDHCVSYSKFSWRKICPDVVLKGMRGARRERVQNYDFRLCRSGPTEGPGGFRLFLVTQVPVFLACRRRDYSFADNAEDNGIPVDQWERLGWVGSNEKLSCEWTVMSSRLSYQGISNFISQTRYNVPRTSSTFLV